MRRSYILYVINDYLCRELCLFPSLAVKSTVYLLRDGR